jgi:hypothetical protein
MELGYFTMPLNPFGSSLSNALETDMEQMVFLMKSASGKLG